MSSLTWTNTLAYDVILHFSIEYYRFVICGKWALAYYGKELITVEKSFMIDVLASQKCNFEFIVAKFYNTTEY